MESAKKVPDDKDKIENVISGYVLYHYDPNSFCNFLGTNCLHKANCAKTKKASHKYTKNQLFHLRSSVLKIKIYNQVCLSRYLLIKPAKIVQCIPTSLLICSTKNKLKIKIYHFTYQSSFCFKTNLNVSIKKGRISIG